MIKKNDNLGKSRKKTTDYGTWQCDINLENAPFIRSSDRARNGADQENKVVAFGADFDARSLRVLAAFHELLLHARKVYHLQSVTD